MKLKLTVIACILVSGFLLCLSYDQYTAHRAKVESKKVAEQNKIAMLTDANETLVGTYNALQAQCALGYKAWQQIPAATVTKLKLEAPNCGLPIVEYP